MSRLKINYEPNRCVEFREVIVDIGVYGKEGLHDQGPEVVIREQVSWFDNVFPYIVGNGLFFSI